MKNLILESLNKEQKEAVAHENGPLLIIAGAGTGKTTVITRRIAWLILEKKIKPDEILALTFTEKASAEMEERVDRLLPYGYVDLWISTFHSFAEKILRLHGLDIGLPTNFRLLSDSEQWFLVRKNLDKFNLDYYRPLGNPAKFIHALLRHFSRAKDEEIGPKEYLAYAESLKLDKDIAPDESAAQETARLAEVANAYHVYQKILLENNALDFGDLINYALKLFKERPNILELYRKQFKYILVDEFQDTNWAQYELVKLLAEPNNNLTVVGDDDQSIYKFRGASISNILTFKKDFQKSRDILLTENYRSTQNILDLSYGFIQQNNPNRLEARMNEKKSNGGLENISKKLIAQIKEIGIIEYILANTQEQEARQAAEKILRLYNQSLQSKTQDAKNKIQDTRSKIQDSHWSDFAVLVRSNSGADIFMRAFEAAGIPFEFLASRGLFTKPLIMDVLAYFRLLDNYHESSALYRLLTSSIFAIDHNDLVKILNEGRKKSLSLFESCQIFKTSPSISESSRKIIGSLLNLIEKHTAAARTKTVSRVLYDFINDSGLLTKILKKPDSYNFVNLLRQLFKKIEAFEESASEPTVRNFVETIDLAMEAGDEGSLENPEDSGPDTVKIMTIHGAKGLEFQYVFVVQMVDKRFPTIERKDPIELPDALIKEILPLGDIHLEEERRLMYVAMTRAKKGLFLTAAEDYGGKQMKKPSRFLVELGFVKEKAKEKKSKIDLTVEEMKANDKSSKFKIQSSKLPDSLPKQFSFTQLRAFETCPYQYRFAHILKIPVEGKHTFSFGKTMHKTLEVFYRKVQELNVKEQAGLFNQNNQPNDIVKAPSFDELLKIYEESWIGDWYESKTHHDDYYKKGKEILKDFYEKNNGAWTVPDALEKAFHLKIGEYTLKGVIDRIDKLPSGKIEIIDYKTGRPKEDGKISSEDKEQLFIYQIASLDVLKAEPEVLSYYYFSNNTKVSFLGEAADLEKIKNKITDTIEAIRQSEFPALPDPMKCKFCDFAKICEFRKLS
ncbi:ATP-dependent helicase [Patescibacteria group bacterium]|nr:MAG: ATP-dependent helicase [Patescibacteria group bacterium]